MGDCIPFAERRVSLNIDDLPDLESDSRLRSILYERCDRTEDTFRRGGGTGGTSGTGSREEPNRERSLIADESSPANTDDLPANDLKISPEHQPLDRDGKVRRCVQIVVSLRQSLFSAVDYIVGGKFAPSLGQRIPPSLSAAVERPAEIGTTNDKQKIMMAARGGSSVILRMTMLAASFVVGMKGVSIYQVEQESGARIYCRNHNQISVGNRPMVEFYIEGPPAAVQHAVDVMCHAIQLYKDLAEGNHSGMHVKRLHRLDNVIFRYVPPPRSELPFAAQVEYDDAEIRIFSNLRGRHCPAAIRNINLWLARRDENFMRGPLASRRSYRRYPSSRLGLMPGIELGEPAVQDHGTQERNVFNEIDSVSSSISQ